MAPDARIQSTYGLVRRGLPNRVYVYGQGTASTSLVVALECSGYNRINRKWLLNMRCTGDEIDTHTLLPSVEMIEGSPTHETSIILSEPGKAQVLRSVLNPVRKTLYDHELLQLQPLVVPPCSPTVALHRCCPLYSRVT